MSGPGRFARAVAFPLLEGLLGRKNTVRLARSLTMFARRDLPNDMAVNGERSVQRAVLARAPRPAVVFDVGANAGEWSRSLLALAGDAEVTVHAFEPASATFAVLQRNLGSEATRMRLVREALSSASGMAQLHIVGDGLGVNSLHGRDDARRTETITLNTVDAYCQSAGIARIDLMKIDAEGHDLAVMEGASAMLDRQAVSVLQFEYNQRWIDSRHFLKDAFDLLLPLGYELGKVTPKGIEFYPTYHFELESFREGNYVACVRGMKEAFLQVRWWNLP